MATWFIVTIIVWAILALVFYNAATSKKNLYDEEGNPRPIELTTFRKLEASFWLLSKLLPKDKLADLKLKFPYFTEEQIKKDEEEGEDMGYFTTIAGVKFHCDASSIGAFSGVIIAHPDNAKDKNAIAVVSIKPKFQLVGYIARDEQEDYKEWCCGLPFPCAGYINSSEEGRLFGRVKAIRPYTPEQVEEETQNFWDWVKKNRC